MAIEYSYLVASIILFSVMILVQSVAGVLHHGLVPLAGGRDALDQDSAFGARAKRANMNMIEGLAMFAPLVVVAVESGRANEMTAMGAGLFLGARILYAPLYWFAVPWLRTLAWAAGLAGTLIILFQILPFLGAA